MNYLRTVLIIVILLIASLVPTTYAAVLDKTFFAKMADGTELSENDLSGLVQRHKRWLKSGGREGKRLNLDGATVTGADFRGAVLRKATMRGASFESTFFDDVNFYKADLSGISFKNCSMLKVIIGKAKLPEATIYNCKFKKAQIFSTDISDSTIVSSDFTESKMDDVNFSGTSFVTVIFNKVFMNKIKIINASAFGVSLWKARIKDTDFSNTKTYSVDFNGAKLNILPGKIPDIGTLYGAKNLGSISYDHTPYTLFELRSAAKSAGLRSHERQLTYAIKRNERIKTYSASWSALAYVLFEMPSGWGRYPGRPLIIMLILIPAFFLPYLVSLAATKKKDGIWQTWSTDRARTDLGSSYPLRLKFGLSSWRAYTYAFYFSILSAFHIGWRDLNVGNWITRMQPHEYTLRATGWVRVVSGVQSLISVYLLALAVLTYFGRPFG